MHIRVLAVVAAGMAAMAMRANPLPAQTPRARICDVQSLPGQTECGLSPVQTPRARICDVQPLPTTRSPSQGAAHGGPPVEQVRESTVRIASPSFAPWSRPALARTAVIAPGPLPARETLPRPALPPVAPPKVAPERLPARPMPTPPIAPDTPTASTPPLVAPTDVDSRTFGKALTGPPSPFTPDPDYAPLGYDADGQLGIYEGKWCDPTQRPWIELGRGLYRFGQLPPALSVPFGETNLTIPHFLLYGDFRTAVAYNDNGPNAREQGVIANRLNLDLDWKLTATERIHMFWGPLDRGGRFSRMEIDDEDIDLIPEFDDNFDTLFFEGDAGAIWGGFTEQWAPFDLPFTAGKYPLLLENGIWIVDALEGFALSVITQNSPALDISNYDVTFFAGFDDVDSPAFGNDDNAANVYGLMSFADTLGGYLELGYAYLDDTTGQGRSYHNATVSFTRRYGQRISNSVRLIVNAGQSPRQGAQTADGLLLLLENQLVSSNPTFFVPYLNVFAGFDVPQSVARALGTGGVLVNTGINFETDGLTGYPTLDATGNNAYGGSLGVNMLGPDFAWQYIVELSTVQTFGEQRFRQAVADQYAVGTRLQIPVTNAWLVRFDMLYGLLEDAEDIGGARMELRWKF